MFPASLLFRSFTANRQSARRQSAQSSRHRRRIFFECLEERRVLAATLALNGAGGGGGGAMILDNSFDTDGRVRTDLSPNHVDFAWDTAIQSDGKIVAVGQLRGASGAPDFAVVRYNAVDGSIDTSFSPADDDGPTGPDRAGVFKLNFTGGEDVAKAVAIQPDGKIVVAGYADAGGQGFNFAVIRLNEDGTLDSMFAPDTTGPSDFGDGVRTIHFGISDFGEDVALQSDGKIVIVGTVNAASVGVARLNVDGSLDTAADSTPTTNFNTTGTRLLDLGPSDANEFGMSVAISSELTPTIAIGAEIITTDPITFNGVSHVAVASLNLDGTNNGAFNGGVATMQFTAAAFPQYPSGANIAEIGFQGNQVVATGTVLHLPATGTANLEDAFLLRFNADGTRDMTFGGTGFVATNISAESRDRAHDMVVQSDGKIVVAGSSDAGTTGDDFLLLRYNANGTPDTTFAPGNQSFIRTDFNASSHDVGHGVAMTATGIVVAGSLNGNANDFALARYVIEPGGPVTLPAISEGQCTTLSGTFANASAAAKLEIKWGDGDITTINVIDLVGSSFAIDHRYLDNPTNGTSYPITAQILDGADSSSIATATIAVSNVAPVFVTVNSATVNEGGTATITGSFADAGIVPTADTLSRIDSHTIVVTWATGVTSEAIIDPLMRTFTASRQYADDTPTGTASDTFTVNLVLSDNEGLAAPTASTSTTVTVNNVAPVASLAAPPLGLRGQPVALAGSFTDVGILDTHQVKWTFGDGTEIPFQPSTNAGALTPARAYATAGDYVVTLTVKDDDGGEHSVSKTVSIVAVMMQTAPGGVGTAVAVAGTEGSDVIAVGTVSGGVEVTINAVSFGVWNPTQAVVAYAYGGDDEAKIDGSVALSAWIYAGAGNDRVKGGAGSDVILGQLGDDLLVGGSGRDILIGGMGADRIVGNCDDDILISGTTDHDANVAALAAILAEWTSTRSASERINNLSGTGTGEKANGTYYLTQDKVYDDGVRDVMTGSSGFDWFFANLGSESDPAKDKITDLSAAEFASDLEFIGS